MIFWVYLLNRFSKYSEESVVSNVIVASYMLKTYSYGRLVDICNVHYIDYLSQVTKFLQDKKPYLTVDVLRKVLCYTTDTELLYVFVNGQFFAAKSLNGGQLYNITLLTSFTVQT